MSRPARSISLRETVFEVIDRIRIEIDSERQHDRYSRPATYSEAVMRVLREAGRVATK